MKRFYLFALCTLSFALSFWLMWHTLSYNSQSHTILISGKYWSDFGGHLPLIRSFSKGSNWPPEYATFPGVPIRYHFIFYFFAGLLEKTGLRLDWALNLPSALGFFLLLVLIYLFSFRLFQRHLVSFLSVIFFLFNGSLSWLDFLQKNNISDLPKLIPFPSFGPWNGSQISAFWNLNIYTNQRHLGLSFAIALLIINLLYIRRYIFVVGFLTGLLLMLNQAAFLVAVLFIAWFFLVDSKLRLPLIISSLGGLPWLYFSLRTIPISSGITYHPLFLLQPPLNLSTILRYWFFNIGPHLILIPLGFLLSPRRAKILILPLLVLFIAPNIWQFSVDMINNHKFFNFFLFVGSMYSAYALSRYKLLLVLVPLLILGGIVDFFPVKNDTYGSLPDIQANPDAAYFLTHTPPDSIVLNSYWYYHPASLAGRKIFNGYSYFSWALGYDQVPRERLTVNIYTAPDKLTACRLLKSNHISFIELNDHPEGFIKPNWDLWKNQFTPVYRNPASGTSVYNVSTSCPNISS
ncbi:hypothetical protein HYS82_03130 [Candidatus Amesbacteria bacterium]|nr:hypothetical protein [Candidatus Amesbacteria bacterium]